MIDVSELKVGDQVKIIDKWPGFVGQNNAGKMDKYLGQIVTVSEVLSSCFHIAEDNYENCNTKWFFFSAMIDYVLPPNESDADIFMPDSLLSDLLE